MNTTKERITDSNMDQHNRYSKECAAQDALRIYLSNFAGDMATICHANSPAQGYPMGSVAPFVIDHTGHPVVLTAGIAQHTKNALENPKTSLMVREVAKNHHIETGWRLTSMGDFQRVTGADRDRVRAHYLRHYPHAELYEGTHDFDFFRLTIKVARLILGFGRISWVDAEDLCHASPFDEATEHSVITHMNEDHVDAMKTYLTANNVTLAPNAKDPRMVGVNQFGVTVSYRKRLHFIAFTNEAHDVQAVRKELVALVHGGK